MGILKMVKMRKWPYPQLQKVSGDELNSFFHQEGAMATQYRKNKIKETDRDQFYRSIGYAFSWGLIIYGIIMVAFYLAVAVAAIKLFKMFMAA
jgi:hypothetical protein